jgi:hypothetical protein
VRVLLIALIYIGKGEGELHGGGATRMNGEILICDPISE